MSKRRYGYVHAHPPTTAHNYLAKLQALVAQGLVRGLADVAVVHDDWCNALYRRGYCNCDPEITVHEET